ncbi:hypothetical protein BLNAU_3639 [Blattamonas nauphoetae]|uniref:PB1 domain-containing protein n=1 Tax=Blattamonas nauphoetae TaxID=2049346 RepID=A0ABQ9YCM1_9EUKA|nr:hypothetical protein BLNAU_3639 [Blattamonas nauphoetae]
MTLVIKVIYYQSVDIRRFLVPDSITYEELSRKISELFEIQDLTQVVFRYVDDERDMVILNSEEALKAAKEVAGEKKSLKVFVMPNRPRQEGDEKECSEGKGPECRRGGKKMWKRMKMMRRYGMMKLPEEGKECEFRSGGPPPFGPPPFHGGPHCHGGPPPFCGPHGHKGPSPFCGPHGHGGCGGHGGRPHGPPCCHGPPMHHGPPGHFGPPMGCGEFGGRRRGKHCGGRGGHCGGRGGHWGGRGGHCERSGSEGRMPPHFDGHRGRHGHHYGPPHGMPFGQNGDFGFGMRGPAPWMFRRGGFGDYPSGSESQTDPQTGFQTDSGTESQ